MLHLNAGLVFGSIQDHTVREESVQILRVAQSLLTVTTSNTCRVSLIVDINAFSVIVAELGFIWLAFNKEICYLDYKIIFHPRVIYSC